MGVLRNSFVFLKQFGTQFTTTGSLLPSSRFLAKAITSELRKRGDAPIRVLECGPGTGAFTNEIVNHLRDGDVYDLVEINSAFVEVLNKRFESEAHWSAHRERSTVHEGSLEGFDTGEPYDFIISGIPHNNLPADLVTTITDTYFRVLKSTGTLSYFEYAYIRPMRKFLTLGLGGKRSNERNAILKQHCDERRLRRDTVLANFPPAWVQHLNGAIKSE